MAIAYTNIWEDKVLSPLESLIKNEFVGYSVYVAEEYEHKGNMSFKLWGLSQASIEDSTASYTNNYAVDIAYYLLAPNMRESAIEKLYKDVSRIERLLFNNKNNQPNYYNGRILSIEFNLKTEDESFVEGLIVARIKFVCSYTEVV